MLSLPSFLQIARNFLAQLALVSLILEQFLFVSSATAQTLPITPDGSTNTQITRTASGVDQVNIAAPNSNGLSHNKFTDYNVNTGGQVINNFSGNNPAEVAAGSGATAVTQTQIGGLVTANSNLVNSGSAKVILNEVTSNNISQLLGYTEIAGTKADLILANPNGIACAGCGFINTAKLLMVAGSSNFDSNGNLGFNLKEQSNPNLYVPLITISGLGLDVTRNTSTDIVASSIKLLSTIYGSNSNSVALRVGEGRYDYTNKTITASSSSLTPTSAVFAIDASSLAKIQAGQVYLIATKQGVGVNMAAEVLASSTVNIDANGDVYYENISAGDSVSLKSTQKIQSIDSSASVSAPNLTIQANEFRNSGNALANNLTIQNTSNLNNFGSVQALNLNLNNITNTNNSGLIFGQNSLSISGTNLTNNSGATIYSPVDYTIVLTGLLTNSGLINSAGNLNVNSNQLVNNLEISAQNNLTLTITDSATNSGNLIATKDLNITANSLTNSGATKSSGISNFNLASLTNNQNSSIYSDTTLTLNLSSSLGNSGSISSQGNLNITGNSTITNSSQILSNSDINVSAASLNNEQDSVIASLTKTLTLALSGNLQNDGNLNSATDLTISANSFSNSGNILAGTTSQTKKENSDEIIVSINSLGNLSTTSSSDFTNSGNLQSTKDSTINSSGVFANSGNILSYANLNLTSAGLNNSATISAQNNLAITNSSSSLINSGNLYGQNDLNIQNSKDLQNSGTIYSDSGLTISSVNFSNLAAASIFSKGNANLTVYGTFSNSGDLQSNNLLNIGSFSFFPLISLTAQNSAPIEASFTNSGNIVSKYLTISSFGDLNNSGSIGSYKDLTIWGNNLNNNESASIKSLTTVRINLTGNLENSENSLIYSAGILNLSATGYLNNAGEISASDSANLSFSFVSNSNKILANNSLTINSSSIDNNSATIAAVNADLTFNLTDYLHNSGTIFAKANLILSDGVALNSISNSGSISFNKLANANSELKVKDFTNSGIFSSASTSDDLVITSSNNFDNSGNISSGKNFTINSQNILTNSGNLTASYNLNLNTNSIDNSGQIGAINNLTINSSDVSNSGNILANKEINISATSINNAVNSVISSLSGSVTSVTSGDVNNYGEISSKTDLSLSAANLYNYSNIIAANSLTINNSGLINNSGNFQSSAATNLTSTSLTNSGKIYSATDATISNSGDFTNSGTLAAANNISVSANNLTNSNLIQSGNDSNITLTGNLSNNANGAIYSGNNLTLTSTGSSSSITNSGAISVINSANFSAASFINSNSILSNNDLTINANSITNNSSATLASINQALNFNITDFLTNSGTIFAKTNFTLANNVTLNSVTNSGSISFNKLANTNNELKAKSFTNSGKISSNSTADSLTITAQNSFDNSGTLAAQESFTINSTALIGRTTNNSGTINSATNLTLNSKNLNNSGQISALNNLTITDSSAIINSSQILANGVLTINAQNLTNGSDSISNSAIASLGNSLTLNISDQLKNYGQFSSSSDLAITAQDFTNSTKGNVLAGAKLNQTISNSITNSGNFQSISDTTLSAASLNNSGTIKSFGTSTININSIINQANAVIFSSSDSKITSSTSLTNQGNIFSNAKLEIAAATLNNSNSISSNSDLTLTLTDTFTNSGNLSSVTNLSVNSTSSITNSSQILALGNLSLTSATLTNSNTIQSNGNLVLNLSSLNNSKNIISGSTLNATTTGAITNSGTLQSGDKFTINAASLTNSSSALVLAGKDLSITASSITNQNTKPSNTSISAGIVSANGTITIKADNFNNSSGIVAGQSTTLNALTASSVNLNNTSGVFVSTAAILLNLGSLDYTITGTVTASNVDITANNITNIGNVVASNYINLNATSGNITNGTATGDNSNIQLAAGTYVNLTASNNINNYATIQGSTDTTLTATNGSINNYSTGKITGGTGTLTLNSLNNAFNNLSATSLLTANNNAIFNVKDLNNNGSIDVANNLTTNVTNNLNNNSTALIWSGNNMTLNVANTLTNTSADIYANKNLTIQKDSLGNKLSSLQNISGNIETYNGDIIINASTISNTRSAFKTQNLAKSYGCWTYQRDYACFGTLGGNDVVRASISGSMGNQGAILSGAKITINTDNLTNDASTLSSVGNTTINYSGSLNNNSRVYESYTKNMWNCWGGCLNGGVEAAIARTGKNNYYSESYLAYIKTGGALSITQNNTNLTSSFVNGNNVVQNTLVTGIASQSKSTTINNINSYTLAQTGVVNVDLSSIISAIGNSGVSTSGSSYNVSSSASNSGASNQVEAQDVKKSNLAGTSSQVSATSSGGSVSEVNSKTVTANAVSAPTSSSTSADSSGNGTISASSVSTSSSNTVFSGLFKINLDPAATTPLVESRSQFTDASKFFGSTYYFNQLGLNGSSVLSDIERQTRNTNIRMLGDAFVETQLIANQLKTLTNNSLFLSKNTNDASAQIKELLDNSVSEFASLGLNAEDVAINGLSTAQANSLSKDIVTFELTKVNGVEVLAPKIYLSQSTRNGLLNSDSVTGATSLATNSTIFGNTGLTIDAANSDSTNNGSIGSNSNLVLNLASLTNQSSSVNSAQIISGNDLTITANTGDIKNIGANIGSVNNLNLTAINGNILNTAVVQTDDANLLNSSFGSLGGGNSYQLASGDVALSSGNIYSSLLQNASLKGGAINITAANDFNNLAASISSSKNTLTDGSTSSGDLNILAGNDINVQTLQVHNHSEFHWGTKKDGGDIVNDTVTNLQSNLNVAGNLDSGSANDTTLQAANISVGTTGDSTSGNTNVNAGGNLLLLTAQDSSLASSSIRQNGTFTFKNMDKGHNDTTVINNQISSTNSMNLTADNAAYLEYKSGTNTSQNIQDQLAALKSQTTLTNPIDEMHKSWDQTNRGLNQTGTLVIAVAGAALTGGLGSFATIGAAAVSAGVGAAGTIAATSATNTAIDGGNLGSTLKQTVKDTTSRDSLEQIAISAAAAGIATGASNFAGVGNTANAANAANTTANTVSTGERVLANVGTALARSSIYAASNIAATSAVKGQSISDSINDNGGVKQIILTTVASSIAEAGAKEIGRAAHGTTTTLTDSSGNPLRNLDGSVMTSSQINQPTQLALHGVLGATTSTLMGGDALSGAAAGVLGELAADSAYQEGTGSFNRQQAIAIGQAAGAAAALATSSAQGKSDEQTAANVGIGGFIGMNAAVNNSTLIDKSGKILKVDKEDGDKGIYIDNGDGGSNKDIYIGDSRYMDTFISPESGEVKGNIHIGSSVDNLIFNASEMGGATVKNPVDLVYLASDSLGKDGPFNIKTKLGAFDGYLLNGEYVTGRDAGNYLAGVNATKAGMPENVTMFTSGVVQFGQSLAKGDLRSPLPPYYGEIPYSGRMIQNGIRETLNPTQINRTPLTSQPTQFDNSVKSILQNGLF